VNKLNNVNVNYLKTSQKHGGPHKMPSRATCGPFFFEIPAPVKNQEWQHWSQLTQYLTTHLAIVQRTVTR